MIYLSFIGLFLCCYCLQATNVFPQSELNALHDLYLSTNGGNWTWNGVGMIWDFSESDPNPCFEEWQGIYCTSDCLDPLVPCNVENIALRGYNLAGSLPDSIGNFTLLLGIDLGANKINGTLPNQICELKNLLLLYVDSNKLVGYMPGDIGQLTHLTSLNLQSNLISGPIPASLGDATKLQNLNLCENLFHGPIPASLPVKLNKLLTLSLCSNNLTGPIPTSIGNLLSLQKLYLQDNKLLGTLPSTLSALTRLTIFNLATNHFTGTVPTFLSTYTLLNQLSMDENSFHGPLPNLFFAAFLSLTVFTISDNRLTNTLPSTLYRCSTLDTLILSHNSFNGTLSEDVRNLSGLTQLLLNDNRFSGFLPTSLQFLTSLTTLSLGSNGFTGNLPPTMALLTQIHYFNVSGNTLGGRLPTSLGNLTGMVTLDVSDNAFTGHLPDSLGVWKSVRVCLLHHNKLSGTVSDSLMTGWRESLVVLDMSHNGFTGMLPGVLTGITTTGTGITTGIVTGNVTGTVTGTAIGTVTGTATVTGIAAGIVTGNITGIVWPVLQVVQLQDNVFRGVLPCMMMSHWPDIRVINMSGNAFTGQIFGHSHNADDVFSPTLLSLDVSDNQLSGQLSTYFGQTTALVALLLQGNAFTGDISGLFIPVSSSVSSSVSSGVSYDFLELFDASQNHFTGMLTDSLLGMLPQLTYLNLLRNCLDSVAIPDSICLSNRHLQTLLLDGLQAANHCPAVYHFSLTGNAYTFSPTTHPSTVPDCLFGMSELRTLSLSGNGYTGTLPVNLSDKSSLTRLSLAYNRMSGDIPSDIQSMSWRVLDLSNNFFRGEWMSNNVSSSDISFLNVSYNHLSGDIPGQLYTMSGGLNLLAGNRFSCPDMSDGQTYDVPSSDPMSRSYVCDSDNVGHMLYVWTCLIGSSCLVLLVGYVYVRYTQHVQQHVRHVRDVQQHVQQHQWMSKTSFPLTGITDTTIPVTPSHLPPPHTGMHTVVSPVWSCFGHYWDILGHYLDILGHYWDILRHWDLSHYHTYTSSDTSLITFITTYYFLFHTYFHDLNTLQTFLGYNMVFFLLVFLPVYCVLSVYYSLYEADTPLWYLSLGYLQGKNAAIIVFLVFFGYALVMLYVHDVLLLDKTVDNAVGVESRRRFMHSTRITLPTSGTGNGTGTNGNTGMTVPVTTGTACRFVETVTQSAAPSMDLSSPSSPRGGTVQGDAEDVRDLSELQTSPDSESIPLTTPHHTSWTWCGCLRNMSERCLTMSKMWRGMLCLASFLLLHTVLSLTIHCYYVLAMSGNVYTPAMQTGMVLGMSGYLIVWNYGIVYPVIRYAFHLMVSATGNTGNVTSDTGKVTSDTGKVTSVTGKVTSDTGKVNGNTGKGIPVSATGNTGKVTGNTGKEIPVPLSRDAEESWKNTERAFISLAMIANQVFFPCFATAFFHPECFYNLLKHTNTMMVVYTIPICRYTITTLSVMMSGVTTNTISTISTMSVTLLCTSSPTTEEVFYPPPFVYSRQCSSAVLSGYVAVYGYQYLLQGVGVLVLWMVRDAWYYRYDTNGTSGNGNTGNGNGISGNGISGNVNGIGVTGKTGNGNGNTGKGELVDSDLMLPDSSVLEMSESISSATTRFTTTEEVEEAVVAGGNPAVQYNPMLPVHHYHQQYHHSTSGITGNTGIGGEEEDGSMSSLSATTSQRHMSELRTNLSETLSNNLSNTLSENMSETLSENLSDTMTTKNTLTNSCPPQLHTTSLLQYLPMCPKQLWLCLLYQDMVLLATFGLAFPVLGLVIIGYEGVVMIGYQHIRVGRTLHLLTTLTTTTNTTNTTNNTRLQQQVQEQPDEETPPETHQETPQETPLKPQETHSETPQKPQETPQKPQETHQKPQETHQKPQKTHQETPPPPPPLTTPLTAMTIAFLWQCIAEECVAVLPSVLPCLPGVFFCSTTFMAFFLFDIYASDVSGDVRLLDSFWLCLVMLLLPLWGTVLYSLGMEWVVAVVPEQYFELRFFRRRQRQRTRLHQQLHGNIQQHIQQSIQQNIQQNIQQSIQQDRLSVEDTGMSNGMADGMAGVAGRQRMSHSSQQTNQSYYMYRYSTSGPPQQQQRMSTNTETGSGTGTVSRDNTIVTL